ncbi:GNAT family protein [soil metagenome]
MPDSEPIKMLRGENVMLGPLRRDLVETYQRWFNDLSVLRTLAAPNLPMTRDAEDAWLDTLLKDRSDAVFTIYVRESGRPIGNTGLHNINHTHGTADFGIVIGEPDAWNQGYGTETTRLLLNYGFDVLGLKNIMLEVYGTNPSGARAYEKAGFRRIGVRRSAMAVGRERTDVTFMDAVPEDIPPSDLHSLLVDGPPRD